MRLPGIDTWRLLAGAGALAWPFAVWFGYDSIPPAVFVVAGIACLIPRSALLSKTAVLVVAGTMAAILITAPRLAVLVWPVALSLTMASVFAASLLHPPTIIERLARLRRPDLPPSGVAYTRRVTEVWVGFLLLNAVISLGTAVFGTLDQWLLWNGALSYLAMGALFAGEFLVRRQVRA